MEENYSYISTTQLASQCWQTARINMKTLRMRIHNTASFAALAAAQCLKHSILTEN